MRQPIRMIQLIFSLVVLLVFSSCSGFSVPSDHFDPPDFTPTRTPTDWMVPQSGVYRHTEIAAVALDKIPAYPIKLSKSQSFDFVKPLSDGGCLAVCQVLVNGNESSRDPMNYLQAIRFHANGTLMWDKQYNANPFQGYINSVCVFPDGGFAVSLQVTLNDSTLYPSIDRLYRFSSEGGLLWISKDEQTVPRALQYLFATPNGAVITAGTTSAVKPDGSFDNNDVTLLKFEKDGTRSSMVTIGTPENDNLRNASYSSGTGLLLSWATQLKDSAVTSGIAYRQVSQIGCYDEDLHERWTSVIPLNENFFDVIALPNGEGSLAFASLVASQEDTSVTSSQSIFVYFDHDGARRWTYNVEEKKAWMMAAAKLGDGRFIGGWFWNTEESGEESSLVVLSPSGSVLKTINPLPGILQQIVSTKDGGFTVILRQTVGAIPQPLYISSIWTDSEAIIAHYDSSLNLVWQRSIDQYKHEMRLDVIIPTPDDRLLIG